MVSLAIHMGRRQRGGVGFGISVEIGTIAIAVIILGTSLIAISKLRQRIKIGSIILLTAIWSGLLVIPLLEEYPFRGSVFGLLGLITIISGSGILLMKTRNEANQGMDLTR